MPFQRNFLMYSCQYLNTIEIVFQPSYQPPQADGVVIIEIKNFKNNKFSHQKRSYLNFHRAPLLAPN